MTCEVVFVYSRAMIDIDRLLQLEKTLRPGLQHRIGLYPFGSYIHPKLQEHQIGRKWTLLQSRFVLA